MESRMRRLPSLHTHQGVDLPSGVFWRSRWWLVPPPLPAPTPTKMENVSVFGGGGFSEETERERSTHSTWGPT